MAYEIYQSRHKGYEIDNLLDDVVDLNADVAALKTEYDANKVKMSDGTILPLHLVNTYATKTDLSAKADSTQVAADIATATTDMATQTQVASDFATATTDMATNASVASAIAAAAYTLPEATTSTLGGVKPDGTTITVDSDGTIHSAGGGSGGGHTILNTDGTAVAQEDKLQFLGLNVTDDSTNGKTKVEGIGLNSDSMDDIASTVPTVPSVVVGDANNYSTKEKVVGTWINGKPLYQITIEGTMPNVTTDGTYVSSNVQHNIPNIDMPFIVESFVLDYADWPATSTLVRRLPYTTNAGYQLKASIGRALIQYASAIKAYNGSKVYTTIQYTKTTDT